MSQVFEVIGDEVHIVGYTPVKTQMFKNLDAALDYCRFAEPEEVTIKKVYQGVSGGAVEVLGYKLIYTGSKGER